MSTDDTGIPATSIPTEHEHPKRSRFFGRWLPTLVVIVVVGGLAVALLGRGSGPATSSSPTVGSSGSVNTSGWQVYHDPMNMYSLRLPPGWTAQASTSSGTYGDRTGSMTFTMEGVQLSDPTQGQASGQVIISAEPINSDFARHWYCQAWPAMANNGTFHGIPAQAQPAVWLFNSANAHFQLDVVIPGVLGPPHSSSPMPQPTATPLPASWVATDQNDINGVLATLQPSNPAPLSC